MVNENWLLNGLNNLIKLDRIGKILIDIAIDDKYNVSKETRDIMIELYLSKDNSNLIILEEMLNKLEKDGFI